MTSCVQDKVKCYDNGKPIYVRKNRKCMGNKYDEQGKWEWQCQSNMSTRTFWQVVGYVLTIKK